MSALDTKTALKSEQNKAIVFGVTLTFPQSFGSGNELARFFQKTYLDKLGADGLFRLVARERGDLFTFEYWLNDVDATPKLAGTHGHYVSDYKKDVCLRVVDGKSYLDILLGNTHVGAFESEADFISQELNTYQEEGFILGWQQFSLIEQR